MGRVVITTCGTSLRETALCWTNLPQPLSPTMSWTDLQDQPPLLSAARAFVKGLWKGHTASDIGKRFDAQAWRRPQLRRMSAELAALRLIEERHHLTEQDRIWVVHGSDSVTAEVLEAILTGGTLWPKHHAPTVELKPEPDLDASRADDFSRAACSLCSMIRESASLSGDQLIYNLTGGYKGTAILLGLNAERLVRKMGPKHQPRVYYLFEGGTELIELVVTQDDVYARAG